MASQTQNPAEEIKRLQRCVNDLVSILALPAIYTGGEPSQIISTLLEALLGMLRLDLIYARFRSSAAQVSIEMVRAASARGPIPPPQEIGVMLCQRLGDDPEKWPPVLRSLFPDEEISIVPLRLGLQDESGLIVAGSHRANFPEQTERLVLSVAANQASIGLQEARLLSEQKRVASELDQRVAQRAAELAASNEELRKEIAQRKLKEEELRLNEEALRAAHTQLAKSEERWRSVFENSAIGVALTDLNGRFIATNPVYQRMLSYTEEELQKLTFLDTTHEEHRESNWALVEELLEGKRQQFQIEKRYRRKDGSPVWVRNNVSLVPGTDLVPRFIMALSEDITERKRAEEALRASEQSFRLIVDGIAGLVAIMKGTGEVEGVNRQALEYFGKTVEELGSWSTTDAVHPDDLPGVISAWSHSVKTAAPYDVDHRLRRADGVYRWFHARGLPLRDAQGRIFRWYALLTDIDERKQAEEKLRDSETDLLEAQRLAQLGSWKLNVLSGKVTVSPEIFRRYDVRPEEDSSSADFWFDRIHPEDRDRVREYFERSLVRKSDYEDEYRIVLPDGTVKYQHVRGHPILDKGGNLIEFSGTTIEVTEQVQSRAALQKAFDEIEKSEDQLRAIISAIPTLAWSADPGGSVDFLNQQWLEYTGLSAERAKGPGWETAIHLDDLKRLMDSWESSLVSGAPVEAEARMLRFDGAYRWFLFRAKPLRDESGHIVKWYGTNTDIDDRKRAEEELRRGEAFLAEGQRLSSTGSFSWRVPTGELTWSEELYRIFELDPRVPLTVEQIRDRIHPEDLSAFVENGERVRREGRDFESDFRLQLPDGSVKYIHGSGHGGRDESGQLEYIGTVQDVTQRRLAEEALAKARAELANMARVTTLGVLTASIAHEINQPLSGIVTNASTCLRMLSTDPPNVDGARETARRTIRDGNRTSDVITRLRTLYSKKALSPETMDLNEVTREVISLSLSEIQRNRVILHQELADELPPITGDRIQLQQVILNLLRNASDAMSTVDDRPRDLLIRTERDEEDRVRLSVRDAGVGFDPETADRLFHAFYTTKNDGMGVGLSVSRSIIESHLGHLWATLNDGPGATFSFSIPCGHGGVTYAQGASAT